MWVNLIRVYAAKAIDNEYAYGRLNAGQQPIYVEKSSIRICTIFSFVIDRILDKSIS